MYSFAIGGTILLIATRQRLYNKTNIFVYFFILISEYETLKSKKNIKSELSNHSLN